MMSQPASACTSACFTSTYQIDVGQPHPPRPRDVVEDHEGAERAVLLVRLEERIHHRQAVTEDVGQRDRDQPVAAAGDAAVGAAGAVFDQAGLDVAVLHHHGVVEHGHVGHAAVAVPLVQVGAEHRILFGRRRRGPQLAHNVAVARLDFPEVAGGAELVGDHPHRDAGAAIVAGRPIGDRLAAAEAAMGQQVIEVAGFVPDQVGKHLALVPPRQIRARRRRREIELRGIARMLRHGTRGPPDRA